MGTSERAICPICKSRMESLLIYNEAYWFCVLHGDFPNAAFDADAEKLNPTRQTTGSWIEAVIVSILVFTVRHLDDSSSCQ